MIEIKNLNKHDIGKWVVYHSRHGTNEEGRIKSWNDSFIFVVYKCDLQWDRFKDFTGCATNPTELTFKQID